MINERLGMLRDMSILCTKCYRPVDRALLATGESHSWCPNCHSTFRVPLLFVPEWIVGVIAILIVNLVVNF
jgi:hypothetical protein